MINRRDTHEGIAVRHREATGRQMGRVVGKGRIFREILTGNTQRLVTRLEGRAVSLSVVGVGLMALDHVKMSMGNFLGEASFLYAICHEL